MKATFIAVSSLLLFTSALKAQTETAYITSDKETKLEKREIKKAERKNEVSYQSKEQFSRDFPDAKNIIYSVSKNFEEAEFTENGIRLTAYYDADSKLVGTTTAKEFSDIPAKAQEYIKKHYAGYNVEQVTLFDDNEDNDTDMMLYDTVFDDADNYFVALKSNTEFIIVKV
ncbi:MAG: hypothetical protein ABUT20_08185, partial [Bacteroidota bacterium]